MAEVRTKEQKRKAQTKRLAIQKNGRGIGSSAPQPAGTIFQFSSQKMTIASGAAKTELIDNSLLPYVKNDLRKTILTSLILFGILVGFSFYLGYN